MRSVLQSGTVLKAPDAVTFTPLASLNTPWSVVSTRPMKTGLAATAATTQGQTTRLSEVAPYQLKAVRLVYANWQNAFGSAEAPNYNGIRVKAAVHKAGIATPNRDAADPLFAVQFGGKTYGYVKSGGILITDPIPVSVLQGERWWHESYVDTLIGPGPSSPSAAASAGTGGFGVGVTQYFVLTYVYPDGSESLPSAEFSATTSSGNEYITITSPAAVPGIAGYRMYSSASAGAVKYPYPQYPATALGTNLVITGSSAGSNLTGLTRLPANVGYPLGQGTYDNVGEGSINGRDYTDGGLSWTGAGGAGNNFGPIAVLGMAADGQLHTSVALLGDSIQSGTGDRGYGAAQGGFGFRALAGQTARIIYDPTVKPSMGFLQLAQGGEQYGSFVTELGGGRRRAVAEHATSILNNYGTNDLGNGAAPIYNYEVTTTGLYAGRKKYFRTTLNPKTNSTDGWKTVGSQSIISTDAEADRRALNNLITTSTGALAVTGEALFRSNGGTAPVSTNFYSGADGTAKNFYAAYPFRQGTETVKVAGVTKALTTDYTYRFTATINGVAYASGIAFVTAPANGSAVTMDYTKVASFGTLAGYTGYFDTASAVEVNSAGTPQLNGGFWKAAAGGVLETGTGTSFASTAVNDTTKAWAVDQWRGMIVRITADATTPASVGQTEDIQSNTATSLKTGTAWTTIPSANATYEIFNAYTVDGVHPTSQGHLEKSRIIDLTKF